MIGQLQRDGALWTINTGRSVELLESGLLDFEFPIRPDFILTSERDVFRPSHNGGKWEPFGDWNDRCAQAHAELFNSAQSVLTEIIDFVNGKTKARVIYLGPAAEGVVATSEEEMDRITEFVEQVRTRQPEFNYQRNTIYLRFCHADYHKGAALAELSRLINIPREEIFAAGDHHNDVSMLDGAFRRDAGLPRQCDRPGERCSALSPRLHGRARIWCRRSRSPVAFSERKCVEGLKSWRVELAVAPTASTLQRFNSSNVPRHRNWQLRVGVDFAGEPVSHVGHHEDPESKGKGEKGKLQRQRQRIDNRH